MRETRCRAAPGPLLSCFFTLDTCQTCSPNFRKFVRAPIKEGRLAVLSSQIGRANGRGEIVYPRSRRSYVCFRLSDNACFPVRYKR